MPVITWEGPQISPAQLPAGTGYTSIEIKVDLLRPVTADIGPLTSTGRVTKLGRRVAFAEQASAVKLLRASTVGARIDAWVEESHCCAGSTWEP